MYKLGTVNPIILKNKKQVLETLESLGITIECPKSKTDTYRISLTTYCYKRNYIAQTWTFDEALNIATKILYESSNHNF